jgi:hypothetical protein
VARRRLVLLLEVRQRQGAGMLLVWVLLFPGPDLGFDLPRQSTVGPEVIPADDDVQPAPAPLNRRSLVDLGP